MIIGIAEENRVFTHVNGECQMSMRIIPVPVKTFSGFAGWCMLIWCMTASVYAAENPQNKVIAVGNAKPGDASVRSLQVKLLGQRNNSIKTSWPGICTWFWVAAEFRHEGYKRFIDLHEKHSNIRLLATSIRHPVWVTDPEVHDQIKAAAIYARAHDMAMVMDLDVRLARQAFMEKYPDELQELVELSEVALKESGNVALKIGSQGFGDHYTFCAEKYRPVSGRLLRAYSYSDGVDDVQEITRRCKVEQADNSAVQVSIACTALDKGRKACVMAAFKLFTPDVFAPHLAEFEKAILQQYADVPLAGACKDEWGFPGRFSPSFSDLWFSEAMADAYAKRRPGHDLSRDLFLMFKGEKGKGGARAAAINYYMQMCWQRNAEVENQYYRSIKEMFGKDAMAGTHPTWVPFPDNREIFKNGLDWWAVKRDLAQTDEGTPYCARTALAKKCHSPLWYNMYYSDNIRSYEKEIWHSVLGGGRLDYHQLFPARDWQMDPEWIKGLLKGNLMRAESRIQLLNYISTKPIDCPVAVIFGHPSALNWAGPGFADVGLKVTDKLWKAGYYADLIPSSEISSGALKIAEDDSIQYGDQRYVAAVLYHPQYEQRAVADFFKKAAAGAKTSLSRVGSWTTDFDGKPFDGAAALPVEMKVVDANGAGEAIVTMLKSAGMEPYTPCAMNGAHYGSSMAPGVSGQMRLLDGTVIHASGKNNVMGDPIKETFSVGGRDVTFDSVGIAAVRLDDNGRLEAMAAGGLKSFQGGGVEIAMPTRADVALWKGKNGTWQGILQGYEGAVPKALTTLCKNWIRLTIPVPAQ